MFVIGLAIGPMVVSPLSEVCLVCPNWLLPKKLTGSTKFYRRRYIYIISISSSLIWLIPVAQNFQMLIIARFLIWISGSAFLSVSGGTVADLFQPIDIQAPMMLYTITPFVGPVLGPLVGGFINEFTTCRALFIELPALNVLTTIQRAMDLLCPPHLDRTHTRFSHSYPRNISSCVARQKSSGHKRAYQEQQLPLGIRACECVKDDFANHPTFTVSTISTAPTRTGVSIFVSLLGAPPRNSLFVLRCLSTGVPC